MRGLLRLCLAAGMASSAGVAATGIAAADAAVDEFLRRVNARAAAIPLSDRDAARAACARFVQDALDIDAIAPVAAAGAWSRMNATQRNAWREALLARAARDCAARRREIAGKSLVLVGVRGDPGGEQLVAMRPDGGGRTMVWRVRRAGDGRLRALDLTVEGRSLAIEAEADARAALEAADGDVRALLRSVGR